MMTRILVTGGAGGLGREVVSRLLPTGHQVRVMSRSSRPGQTPAHLEWAQADVTSGDGVADAVADVDVIINAMSNPANPQAVDVDGTTALLAAARRAGVAHVIHVSIIGIERIPTPYYRAKVAAEEAVIASGVPYTIWRAAQFHTLLDNALKPLLIAETAPILNNPPDAQYQLIDTGEAAEALVLHVDASPAGRLPDVGGPEVLTLEVIIQQWLHAQRITRAVSFGEADPIIAEAVRRGARVAPSNPYGKITWRDYLRGIYAD
jgi:uncharacterized protein YbjT (DUF2867 family)